MVHSPAGPSVACTAKLTDDFDLEYKQILRLHTQLADVSLPVQDAIVLAAFLPKTDIAVGNT